MLHEQSVELTFQEVVGLEVSFVLIKSTACRPKPAVLSHLHSAAASNYMLDLSSIEQLLLRLITMGSNID